MFCESEEWVNKIGNKENKKNLIMQVPKCSLMNWNFILVNNK